MLDFDIGDLDAPRLGVLVQYLLYVRIELVALGEHVIEFVPAENRTQGGLCQLAGGLDPIFHLDNGPFRIEDTEIDHRADLYGNVIPGNDILGGHIHHDGSQVHPNHFLDARDHDDQTRSLDLPETAEQEDDASLVLAKNLDRAEDEQRNCSDHVG